MSVATLIQDLRRRGVVLEAAGEHLDVDAPSGVLTDEDFQTLRRRKYLVLAYLAREREGRAPVLLSAVWPKPGSWQHTYATTGRHPLRCDRCGGRTLRRGDGDRLVCGVGCQPADVEGRR